MVLDIDKIWVVIAGITAEAPENNMPAVDFRTMAPKNAGFYTC